MIRRSHVITQLLPCTFCGSPCSTTNWIFCSLSSLTSLFSFSPFVSQTLQMHFLLSLSSLSLPLSARGISIQFGLWKCFLEIESRRQKHSGNVTPFFERERERLRRRKTLSCRIRSSCTREEREKRRERKRERDRERRRRRRDRRFE